MTNSLNKALIFKEWKTVRLIGILIIVAMLLFKVLPLAINLPIDNEDFLDRHFSRYLHLIPGNGSTDMQSLGEELTVTKDMLKSENSVFFLNILLGKSMEFTDVTIIALILVMCFVQFFPERWGKHESVSFSFPVKKGVIMLNKLLIGFSIIATAILASGLIMLIKYYLNISLLSPYVLASDIIQWIFSSLLAYWSIYALFMFVFSVCGNMFGGLLLGPGVMVYPAGLYILLTMLTQNIARIVNVNSSAIIRDSQLFDIFSSIASSISLFFYSGKYDYQGIYSNNLILKQIPLLSRSWSIDIILLLSITLLLSILSIHYFHNSSLEKRNWFIQFKGFQIAFVIAFAIGFSLMISSLISECIVTSISITAFTGITMMSALISAFLGFVIAYKLIYLGRRNKKSLFGFKKGVRKHEVL